MPKNKKPPNPEQITATMEAALTRLERTVFDHKRQDLAASHERTGYMEQLEEKNRQMTRDMTEMKKHCIALKASYDSLAEKYQRLENINISAERDLAATLQDLDHLIAQKTLH